MASTLKINTLTGVSTAGSIAVTGEGNSTTTNLQQGLCKMWIHFNGTGQMLMSVTNAFSNSNYTHVGGGTHDGGSYVANLYFNHDTSKTTTQAEFDTRKTNEDQLDAEFMSLVYFGDLA